MRAVLKPRCRLGFTRRSSPLSRVWIGTAVSLVSCSATPMDQIRFFHLCGWLLQSSAMTLRHSDGSSSNQSAKRFPAQLPARLPADRQRRLDELMARHNNTALTGAEADELRMLVAEAEAATLSNARALASQTARQKH